MPPLLPASAVRGLAIRSFSTTSPVCALRDTSSNRPSSSSSLLSINNYNNNNNSSSSSSSSSSPRSSPYYNNYNKYRSNQQQNQQQQQGNPGDAANLMMTRLKRDGSVTLRNKQAQLEQLRNQKNSADYLRQMPRRWEAGDVYSPHDMSPVEMQKWRKRSPRKADVVDALGIRPLDMYKVCVFLLLFNSFRLNKQDQLHGEIKLWMIRRGGGGGSDLELASCADDYLELLSDPGIHFDVGPDYAFVWHEPAACQPAQDCKDDSQGAGHGAVPHDPRASRDDQGQLLP